MMKRNVMNDRRWMDRWPLVYDAVTQKNFERKEEKRTFLFARPSLSLSLSLSLSVRSERRRRERERKAKVILSFFLSLYLKQINLISSFFHFFVCFFTKLSLSLSLSPRARKEKVDPSCRKELPPLILSTPTILLLLLYFFSEHFIVRGSLWSHQHSPRRTERTSKAYTSLASAGQCRSNVVSCPSHSDRPARFAGSNVFIRNHSSSSCRDCWAPLLDRPECRTDKSCKGKCWEGQVFICVE